MNPPGPATDSSPPVGRSTDTNLPMPPSMPPSMPGAAHGRSLDVVSGASVAMVVMAGIAATMGLGPVFASGVLWRPVLVGALTPAVVVVGLRVKRLRLAVTAVAALVVVGVAAGPTLFSTTTVAGFVPTGATVHAVVDGFQNGWARLLTTSLPADAEPSLLFVAYAVTAVATWAGTEVATRTRSPVAPAAPVVLAAIVAEAFAISAGESSGLWLGVLVLAVATLVVVRSLPREVARRGRPRGLSPAVARRLARGLPVAVVLAVAAPLLAPHLPGGSSSHPVDPREHRQLDPPPQSAVNPLAQLPGRLARPDQVLFTFRATGEPPPRLRQVVLDGFNGSAWYTAANYEAAGTRLPPGPRVPVRHRHVRLDVTVGALDGIWLPAPDRPTGLTGQPVAWDPVHGIAALAKGDVAGRSYQVDGSIAMPTAAQIEAATVVHDPAALQLPQPVPPALAQLGMAAVRGASSPAQRAKALQLYLRDRFRRPKNPTDAPSGHAYGNLAYLVDPARGDFVGTPEQFAAAYAVIARSIGLPARVVVGFRVPAPGRDGTYVVRAGDATAWPEVQLDGVGWVAFDPDPGVRATASHQRADPPGARDASDAVHTTPDGPDTAPAKPPARHDVSSRGSLAWWVWPLGVLGLAALGALAVWVVRFAGGRRRRARRRGHPDPARRMRGAWLELTDGLRHDGLVLPASTDATTLRDAARSRLSPSAGGPVVALADLVNRTLFRRGGPTDDDARQAWAHVDAYAAARRDRSA